MNADGMPSLWVQTVCVYSVRGLLESNAPARSVSKAKHALTQKERIKLTVGKDSMGTRLSDTTKRAGKQKCQTSDSESVGSHHLLNHENSNHHQTKTDQVATRTSQSGWREPESMLLSHRQYAIAPGATQRRTTSWNQRQARRSYPGRSARA